MRHAVADCRRRRQRKVNNTKLRIQSAGCFLRNQLANAGNFKSSLFYGFSHSADICAAHSFKRMFNNAGSADADINYAFRLGYTMKSTGHKRIILYSIAENYQFGAANSITVSRQFSRLFYHAPHFRNGIHVNAAFGRANTYGRADNLCFSKRFRNRCNKFTVANGIAFINKCRKASDKINANSTPSFIKCFCQRNITFGIAAFANNCNWRYGNALVNNGYAKFCFKFLPYFNKIFCFFGNFIVNFLCRYLDISMSAVTQADAHGNSAHIQIIFGNHAVCF